MFASGHLQCIRGWKSLRCEAHSSSSSACTCFCVSICDPKASCMQNLRMCIVQTVTDVVYLSCCCETLNLIYKYKHQRMWLLHQLSDGLEQLTDQLAALTEPLAEQAMRIHFYQLAGGVPAGGIAERVHRRSSNDTSHGSQQRDSYCVELAVNMHVLPAAWVIQRRASRAYSRLLLPPTPVVESDRQFLCQCLTQGGLSSAWRSMKQHNPAMQGNSVTASDGGAHSWLQPNSEHDTWPQARKCTAR